MAEVATNPLDSTHLAVETKVNLDELIYMLNPDDLPMLGGVNADGFPIIPRTPVDQPTFSWLEDSFLVPRTTLQTTVDNSTTSIVLPADQGERFAAGDLIRLDDEFMLIASISNDTLTVATRPSAGSSAAAHTAGVAVIGVGTMLAEGSIGDEQFTGRTKYSNYTQIWTSKISITRTAQRVPKYGITNELARQTMKVMLAEGVNIEQALLYGIKYQSGNLRATGGLANWVTTNVDTTADWLTVNEIETQQQTVYDAGGMFSAIVANPANFGAVNNLAGAERIQTVTIDDARRGRRRATSVITEFGDVLLVRNRYCMPGDAFGINRENVIFRQLQPMIMQSLAKTNDTDNYMFVCEGGFEVKGQAHMVRWTGLDSSAALPADLV